jgi:hypothetical protein
MSLQASRPRFEVTVIDLEGHVVSAAEVLAKRHPLEEGGVKLVLNEPLRAWTADKLEAGRWVLNVRADFLGLEPQTQEKVVTEEGVQAMFVLGRPGLPFYYRGGAKVPFDAEAIGNLVAVSVKPGSELEIADLRALAEELGLEAVDTAATAKLRGIDGSPAPAVHPKLLPYRERFAEDSSARAARTVGPRRVWVFRAPDDRAAADFERRAARLPFVSHAGAVVHRRGDTISFLTNEIIITLRRGAKIEALLARGREMIASSGVSLTADGELLAVVRHVPYARDVFVLRSSQLSSSDLRGICNRLSEEPGVISAEPNLVSTVMLHFTPDDFTGQMHHPLIRSEGAWDIARANGNGKPLIAVIDEGCDVSHPDLALSDQFDFASLTRTLFPSPHGTMTAGVAAATFDNGIGIAGVAGMCGLMAIQYPLGLADDDYADMFEWCAGLDPQNPNRPIPPAPIPGADVISNSWGLGPERPLSTVVQAALDHVTTHGRGGKGCVVVFAAGNESDNLAIKQPWAAHPNVIAVGSSSIDVPEVRVASSNFGSSLDLCAPGGDHFGATYSTTAGVVSQKGTPGLYAVLGQTSCACPQVAGVAALMLAVNPNLTGQEVREILHATARRIDEANTVYVDGHSEFYGYGCLNAEAAVGEALKRHGS